MDSEQPRTEPPGPTRAGPDVETEPEGAAGPGAEPGWVPPPPEDAVVAELTARWRQALADLDNLRKRYARQLAREQAAERARVTAAWLPMLDNLELALEHAGADAGAVVEGVRTVRDQAVNLLAALGYPRHDETGVPFDPTRHEAVSVATGTEAAPGTVLQVLRAGYGDGERQLRPAAVVVAGDRE
jgi:molecular chaperone GrpE